MYFLDCLIEIDPDILLDGKNLYRGRLQDLSRRLAFQMAQSIILLAFGLV